jgi:YhgE/Pip-like protein
MGIQAHAPRFGRDPFDPLIYCVIYLSAFYDPYENLEYLPVALVNEDQGAVRDGENLHVGNELVEELQKDSKVKWEVTDRNKLEEGLDKGPITWESSSPRTSRKPWFPWILRNR